MPPGAAHACGINRRLALGLVVGFFSGLAVDAVWEVLAQSFPDGKLEAAERFEQRTPRLVASVLVATVLGGCAARLPRTPSFAAIGSLAGGSLGFATANILVHASLPTPVLGHEWHAEMRQVVPLAVTAGAIAGLLLGIVLSAVYQHRRKMHR